MSSKDLRAEILSRIQAIASEILALPSLRLEENMTAHDVPGWDSLTHVQIVIGVEREFEVRLTSTEVARLENAGSLVDIVLARRRDN